MLGSGAGMHLDRSYDSRTGLRGLRKERCGPLRRRTFDLTRTFGGRMLEDGGSFVPAVL
jgi:hypothetical protein